MARQRDQRGEMADRRDVAIDKKADRRDVARDRMAAKGVWTVCLKLMGR